MLNGNYEISDPHCGLAVEDDHPGFDDREHSELLVGVRGPVITSTYYETLRFTLPSVYFSGDIQGVSGPDTLSNQWNYTWKYDGTNPPKIELITTDPRCKPVSVEVEVLGTKFARVAGELRGSSPRLRRRMGVSIRGAANPVKEALAQAAMGLSSEASVSSRRGWAKVAHGLRWTSRKLSTKGAAGRVPIQRRRPAHQNRRIPTNTGRLLARHRRS